MEGLRDAAQEGGVGRCDLEPGVVEDANLDDGIAEVSASGVICPDTAVPKTRGHQNTIDAEKHCGVKLLDPFQQRQQGVLRPQLDRVGARPGQCTGAHEAGIGHPPDQVGRNSSTHDTTLRICPPVPTTVAPAKASLVRRID